jgi:nucleoside-diphosphate-sugar epimerase
MTTPSNFPSPAGQRTVLILGAQGRFGAAAVQAFSAAGWRVLAQMRRAPGALPTQALVLRTDLSATDRLAQEAAGASAVVYAVNPVYTRWDAELLTMARQGMDLAERLGARVLIPGNVYNYGTGMPPLLREDTPWRADTRKGQQRCALEGDLRDRAAWGLRSAVIRAGDFFGAGTGNWFDQAIVKSLREGQLIYPGPLDRVHAWAYLPDLARAFVGIADIDAQDRTALPVAAQFGFAGHALTGAELLAAIADAAADLGVRPAGGFAHRGMPWGLIRAGGLVVPMWRELARMAYLWRVPHAVDGSALSATLPSQQSTPLAIALRRSLVDLGLDAAAAVPGGAAAAARL